MIGLLCGPVTPWDEAAESLLRSMKDTVTATPAHGVLRVRPLVGDDPGSWVRFWIDPERGLVRGEIGSARSPVPRRIVVARSDRIETLGCREGEIGVLEPPEGESFEWGERLASAALGDPIHLAYTGTLLDAGSAFGPPRSTEDKDQVLGRRIEFSGNRACSVWVSADGVPTRSEIERGPVGRPGTPWRTDVRWRARGADALREVSFELPVDLPRLPWTEARTRWRESPIAEQDRWPAVGSTAPPFVAHVGNERRSFEAEPGVLAFAFLGDPNWDQQLAAQLAAPRDDELPVTVIVFPSSEPADAALLAAIRRSAQVVWSGANEGEAFAQYSVENCPVFFRIDRDGRIAASARQWDALWQELPR